MQSTCESHFHSHLVAPAMHRVCESRPIISSPCGPSTLTAAAWLWLGWRRAEALWRNRRHEAHPFLLRIDEPIPRPASRWCKSCREQDYWTHPVCSSSCKLASNKEKADKSTAKAAESHTFLPTTCICHFQANISSFKFLTQCLIRRMQSRKRSCVSKLLRRKRHRGRTLLRHGWASWAVAFDQESTTSREAAPWIQTYQRVRATPRLPN